MAAAANYKPSRCSKFLTTGGETPRHTWLALLQWANRASSCATLLKSRFRCRIRQLKKPSRKLMIPLTMWPKPPLQSLDRMRWTEDKESDSIMIWLRSISLARRIPASIAKTSVSSTEKQPESTRHRAATTCPLQSLIITPILDLYSQKVTAQIWRWTLNVFKCVIITHSSNKPHKTQRCRYSTPNPNIWPKTPWPLPKTPPRPKISKASPKLTPICQTA